MASAKSSQHSIRKFGRVIETGQDPYSTQCDNGIHDHQSTQERSDGRALGTSSYGVRRP